MDLGFKDKSIIDSEEQLAGRINRNVTKPKCTLYLFDCNEEKTLYNDDDRYRIMQELDDEYKTILEQKNFDKLYQLVIEKKKKVNHTHYIINIQDLFEAMATMNFRVVNNSLKIINQQNISVFVPLKVDIHLINEYITTLEELHIPYSTVLNGTDIWNKYVAIIQNQDEDFVKNIIQMKNYNQSHLYLLFQYSPMEKIMKQF
ncbi:MAG: hypothetical protein H6537_04960 [Bacteroidales bacterium]|nr:hypothetical protein [Bacteroidales bacterium]